MKKKTLPAFNSDEEAETFVDSSDLSEYDLSGGQTIRYEFKAKTASINMRVPQELLDAVKAKAKEEGIPYQRYIRKTLESSLLSEKHS